MNDAERRLVTIRLLGLIALSITLSLVNTLVKVKREMEANEVVRDAELFLKASRLQDLVLGKDQRIIDALGNEWSNANYRGPVKPISLEAWIRQNLTDGLSP